MAESGDIDPTTTSTGEEVDFVCMVDEEDPNGRYDAAMWLRKRVGVVAARDLPAEPSEEDCRQGLRSGMILCNLLNKIQPGSVPKVIKAPSPISTTPDSEALAAYSENIKNFLIAIENLGLPTFEPADLEPGGYFSRVVNTVLAMRAYNDWKATIKSVTRKFSWSSPSGKFLQRGTEPAMGGTNEYSMDQDDDGSDPGDEAIHLQEMLIGGKSDSEGGTKLYISNLDEGVTNEDIKALFSDVGELKRYSIHYDRTGRSKGTAEVAYMRQSDAVAAMTRYNNVQLDGKPMRLEMVGLNIVTPVPMAPMQKGILGNHLFPGQTHET